MECNECVNSDDGRPRLLVAEDNPSNFKLVEVLLRRDYELVHAWDGRQAVDMFAEVHPDLVLMDINMPVMDGYDALRLIRERAPDIPVIALTAYAFETDRQRMFQAGFNECLAKPLRADEPSQPYRFAAFAVKEKTMTGNRAIKHWTLLLLSCCILLPSLLRAEEARGRESILIISSYNPDTRRMSSFITEFERQVVASGVPCDIYVETLECKSINDAPLWISQTDNLITRYESKGGLRAIVLLGQEAWASFVSLGRIPKEVMCFRLFRQFERHRAAAAGRQHRRLDAPVDQLYEYGGQPAQRGRPAQQIRRAPQHRA